MKVTYLRMNFNTLDLIELKKCGQQRTKKRGQQIKKRLQQTKKNVNKQQKKCGQHIAQNNISKINISNGVESNGLQIYFFFCIVTG